jgi:serralysin
MANIVSYTPIGVVAKALFNFDAIGPGHSNFRLTGDINVSISQPFMYTQYLNGYGSTKTWTPDVAAVYWNATQVSNINSMLSMYESFINVSFSTVIDSTAYSPYGAAVLTNSDINISLIYRTDLSFSGMSSVNRNNFNYVGSELDLILNINGFGSAGVFNDTSLSNSSFGFHTLMHEFGHSLGLSHPHTSYVNGVATLSSDFSATTSIGFDRLGFVISSNQDMNKEYFSIMSYDDERPVNGANTYAQTPMILDVIALQGAYGVGDGTSGNGDDVITPGGSGGVSSYRTYFDLGGTDKVDLRNYSTGAYLHMGESIIGASHLVGVSMSSSDAQLMIAGSDPQSLRWFYGVFENASGSAGNDYIIGNNFANIIEGGNGADSIEGKGGNDSLYGGTGIDTALYSGSRGQYQIVYNASTNTYTVTDAIANRDGVDVLVNVEYLKFGTAAAQAINLNASPTSTFAATYQIPVSSIQSIGLSPDGQFLLIKTSTDLQKVAIGSSMSFNGATVSTSDLTQSMAPIPVFKSSGGVGGFTLPELFTGPASLGLKYQLIETADNAVVYGSTDNDFIKVSSANSVGKAVNGGGGNDVIDGGVGSTFVTGGGTTANSSTYFLDGRAPGTSWSTITDFKLDIDKATIWGFVKGVSSVDASFTNFNTAGAAGYEGLTLHFKNLLPSGQTSGTNANLNSITLTGRTLQEFGASSLAELNTQINNQTNPNFLVGATQDSAGTHGYLFIN